MEKRKYKNCKDVFENVLFEYQGIEKPKKQIKVNDYLHIYVKSKSPADYAGFRKCIRNQRLSAESAGNQQNRHKLGYTYKIDLK